MIPRHLFRRASRLQPLRRCLATAAEVVKPSAYGQPLFQSHPHLVHPHELTPGIPAEEYETRRRKLMESLPDGSVVVSVAAPVKYMSGHIFYKFRQASDFWYLTGFEEPNAAVVLEKTSSSRGYHMTLFSTGSTPESEKWDGARTPIREASILFHSDDALPVSAFDSYLKSTIAHHTKHTRTRDAGTVYIDTPTNVLPSRKERSLLKHLSSSLGSEKANTRSEWTKLYEGVGLHTGNVKPLAPHIAKLRAIKSPVEQRMMRMAADVSGRAHAKTMRFTQPGMSESAVSAHFEYLCKRDGAQRLAYVPVVASGSNGRIIHYTSNNHLIQPGEAILVDAGCEYNGYAADITRTYPVSGTFSPAQQALYLAVLAVQKSIIAHCYANAGMSMWDLHRLSCELLKIELRQIGFADTVNLDTLYPHFVTHSIGIDLHESDAIDRTSKLRSGMVITVEPGIYVPPIQQFPSEFQGLSIRIEDEVLVGEEHPTVLSVSAPKELADVEGACQGLLGLESF